MTGKREGVRVAAPWGTAGFAEFAGEPSMAKKEPRAVQTDQPCLSLLPRLLEGKIGFDFFVQPASRQAQLCGGWKGSSASGSRARVSAQPPAAPSAAPSPRSDSQRWGGDAASLPQRPQPPLADIHIALLMMEKATLQVMVESLGSHC